MDVWRTLAGTVAVLALVPASARANEEQAHPGLTLTAADAKLGTDVTATATLSQGDAPTGTVTVRAYTSDCGGAPAFSSDAVTVSGNGSYTAHLAPDHPGTYHLLAVYGGDAGNAAATSNCTTKIAIGQAQPTLTVTATNATLGSPVSATATLANAHDATGAITLRAFSTSDCSGDPVAVSGSFTPAAAGVYHWSASFAGDDDNAPAESGCAATSTVSAVVRPAGTPVVSAPTVRSAVPLTLSHVSGPRCIAQGATTSVRFTLSTAAKVTFTLLKRVRPVPLTRTVCPGPLPGINPSATFRSIAKGVSVAESKGAHRFGLVTTKLKPGRYRVRIDATSADGQKVSAHITFWVLAPH
jgi:hypothetical protein